MPFSKKSKYGSVRIAAARWCSPHLASVMAIYMNMFKHFSSQSLLFWRRNTVVSICPGMLPSSHQSTILYDYVLQLACCKDQSVTLLVACASSGLIYRHMHCILTVAVLPLVVHHAHSCHVFFLAIQVHFLAPCSMQPPHCPLVCCLYPSSIKAILNAAGEIENFFPESIEYYNIR